MLMKEALVRNILNNFFILITEKNLIFWSTSVKILYLLITLFVIWFLFFVEIKIISAILDKSHVSIVPKYDLNVYLIRLIPS